jgi:SAM-dependent methyltransferase
LNESVPPEFFDSIYTWADRDPDVVPWQNAASRGLFAEWAAAHPAEIPGRALVVASGLGDDAAALAARGYAVTAFDYAENAVAWAKDRHPDAQVDWYTADLFDPPPEWQRAFDIVAEVFTIQSIPPERRADSFAAICDFVAPGGTLVLVAFVLGPGADRDQGPPWPLVESDLDRPRNSGLAASADSVDLDVGTDRRCVLRTYRR